MAAESDPWPYAVEDGDHFETSAEALEDIAPLLRLAAKRREARGAELRLYDPYFCSGRSAELLAGLGFPCTIHRRRDFYADIAAGLVPSYDVLVTNPPYSGDHKERLFAYILERQRRALRRGVPEPFLLLLPSWTVGKALFSRFLRSLAALPGEDRKRPATPARSKEKALSEAQASVFYVCRRGRAGRPRKYGFEHLRGAGAPDCPFFGLWICGGFGDATATARAMRRVLRGRAEGLWEGAWYPCRPRAEAEEVRVLWEDGTTSSLPRSALRGGRLVFASRGALEAASLVRSAEETRRRQEENPGQRRRREVALEARKREARKRRATRRYVCHEGPEPLGQSAEPRCKHFFSEKGCSRGDACRFSHLP